MPSVSNSIAVGRNKAIGQVLVGQYKLTSPAYVTLSIVKASDPRFLIKSLDTVYEFQTAGTKDVYWDLYDSDGNIYIGSDYKVKVAISQVSSTFFKPGNNSTETTGNTLYSSYSRLFGVIPVGNDLFYCEDFNEGSGRIAFYADKSVDWKKKTDIPSSASNDTNLTTIFGCSNGTNVFYYGLDPYPQYSGGDHDTSGTWGFAVSAAGKTEVALSSGTSVKAGLGKTYSKAFGVWKNNAKRPTGMACNSTYVWVGFDSNEIEVYSATTGAYVRTVTTTDVPGLSNPRCLAYDSTNSGRIWILNSTNQILMLNINAGTGNLSSGALTLVGTGTAKKVGLAVYHSGSTAELAIMYGDDAQLIRFWDVSAANPTSNYNYQLGQNHGYQSTAGSSAAVVANDKFCFTNNQTGVKTLKPYISYNNATKDLYVGDPGCFRTLLFDSSKAYVDQLQFIPTAYMVSVDMNNANHVYAEGLEFTVASDLSWTFSRNFAPQLPADFDGDVFKFCSTVDGVTLATIGDNSTLLLPTPTPVITYVFQLTDAGLTNTSFSPEPSTYFTGIFDKNFNIIRTTGSSSIGTQPVVKQRLRTSTTPTYSAETTLFTMDPLLAPDAMINGIGGNFRGITDSGIGIAANPTVTENCGFHLEGYDSTTGAKLCKTFQRTKTTYKGWRPDGRYNDIGNGVIYTIGDSSNIPLVRVVDNLTFVHAHNEGWKSSQTTWTYVYDQDLTCIATFGTSRVEADAEGYSIPYAGGNSISMAVAKVSTGVYRITIGDEAYHSALCIIEANISTTYRYTTLSAPVVEPLPGVDLMHSLTLNSTIISVGNITADAAGTGYTVKCGETSYEKKEVSQKLTCSSNHGVTKKTALGFLRGSGLTTHTVEGYINFEDFYEYNDEDLSSAVLILKDDAGKSIAEIGMVTFNYDYKLRLNSNVLINTTDQNVTVNTLSQWQYFKIVTTSGGCVITYGDNAPVSVAKFDGTSTWNQPKELVVVTRDHGTLHNGYICMAAKECTYHDDGTLAAPTLSTKNTTSTTEISLVFSEGINVSTPGWSFKKNGNNLQIYSVAGVGDTWVFTVGTMANGDTLTVSYDSTVGNTQNYGGKELASITNSSVTNNIPAPSSYAFVDSAKGSGTGSGITSLACSTTINAVTGNFIAVAVAADAGKTCTGVTDTAGNTYVKDKDFTDSGVEVSIWRAANCTGHATNLVTASFSGTVLYPDIYVEQSSGIATSTPLGTTFKGLSAVDGTITSDAFTTTQANEYVFVMYWDTWQGRTWTPPTGYTSHASDINLSGQIASKAYTSVQTGITITATCTTGSFGNRLMVGASYKY
jgi:hypothetical protein